MKWRRLTERRERVESLVADMDNKLIIIDLFVIYLFPK